jgi:hypothetical protein
MNMIRKLAVVAIVTVSFTGRADYVLSLASGGSANVSASPGQVLTIDASLTSDAGDTHNSAIFRLTSSVSGLSYESYRWEAPYRNSTLDDDSKPLLALLPVALTAATLQGGGYPPDTVDFELSNVAGDPGNFGVGKLVSVVLRIPLDYKGPAAITLSAVPDAIANGFDLIPTTVASPLTINVSGPPLGTYALWRAQHFGADAQGLGVPEADPDGDGLSNRLEYVFASDPLQPGGRGNLPASAVEGGRFRLRYTRPSDPTDLAFGYEISGDLRTWRPAVKDVDYRLISSLADGTGGTAVTLEFAASLHAPLFARVRINHSPAP